MVHVGMVLGNFQKTNGAIARLLCFVPPVDFSVHFHILQKALDSLLVVIPLVEHSLHLH